MIIPGNYKVFCNLFGWWILGISADFSFWLVITAAHDLIDLHEEDDTKSGRMCNQDSEGLILTISILPSLIVCLVLPFLPLWINIRYLIMMIVYVASIVMIGINTSWGVTLGGIGLVSVFTGFTTSTLLNYVQVFKSRGIVKSESLIFAWSSGIGTSGLLASGIYLIAIENGVSLQVVVLSTLAVPVFMTAAFYLLISNPQKNPDDACKKEIRLDEENNKINSTIIKEIKRDSNINNLKCKTPNQGNNEDEILDVQKSNNIKNENEYNEQIKKNNEKNATVAQDGQDNEDAKVDVRECTRKQTTYTVEPESSFTLRQKLRLFLPIMLTYSVPYALGFICQYTINQGFFELMSFTSVMPVSSSVRWFQFVFMLSTFIFKSSGRWMKVDYLWTMAGIQSLILIAIAMQSVYAWMGDGYLAFWMVVLLVFMEGAIGALEYVNTYRRINKERPDVDRGFSLSITVLGEPFGTLVAALVSMWIHNQVCNLPSPQDFTDKKINVLHF